MTASPASPVAAGTQVTATAQAAGCPYPNFRFRLVSLATGVGLVMQQWGAANVWSWDTSGQQAGKYAIRVDARGYGVASVNPGATVQAEVDVTH